jgi:hypothetical protein
MELECNLGNVRVPCTTNQALALLVIEGLPKINEKKSRDESIVFEHRPPLSIHGDHKVLCQLRFKLSDTNKDRPLNGSAIAKWMELMQVPDEYTAECRELSSVDLTVVWMRALRQRMPITMVLRIFAA